MALVPRAPSLTSPASLRAGSTFRSISVAPDPLSTGPNGDQQQPELTVNLVAFETMVRRVLAMDGGSSEMWSTLRHMISGATKPMNLGPAADESGLREATDETTLAVMQPSRQAVLLLFGGLIHPNEWAYVLNRRPSEVLEQLLLATAAGAMTLLVAVTCQTCGSVVVSSDHLANLPITAACGTCTDIATVEDLLDIQVFFEISPSIVSCPSAMPRCPITPELLEKRLATVFVPRVTGASSQPSGWRWSTPLAAGEYTLFDPISGCNVAVDVLPAEKELSLAEKALRTPAEAAAAAKARAKISDSVALRMSEPPRCVTVFESDAVEFKLFNDTSFTTVLGVYERLDLRTETYLCEKPNYLNVAQLLQHPTYQKLSLTSGAHLRSFRQHPQPSRPLKIDKAAIVAVQTSGAFAAAQMFGNVVALTHSQRVDECIRGVAYRHTGRVLQSANGSATLWMPTAAHGFAAAVEFAVRAEELALALQRQAKLLRDSDSEKSSDGADTSEGASSSPAFSMNVAVTMGEAMLHVVDGGVPSVFGAQGEAARLLLGQKQPDKSPGRKVSLVERLGLDQEAEEAKKSKVPRIAICVPVVTDAVTEDETVADVLLPYAVEHFGAETDSWTTSIPSVGLPSTKLTSVTVATAMQRLNVSVDSETEDVKPLYDGLLGQLEPATYEPWEIDTTGFFGGLSDDLWPSRQ